MEQLIFVGIIVLFSVLEAVARKNKAKQGGGEGVPLPEEPHQRRPHPRPRPAAEPQAGTVPHSYDDDPSFDDAAGEAEAQRRRAPAPPEAPAAEPAGAPTGSEGLIPADVWEEIQRMARGELPEAETAPVPVPRAPAPAPRPPRVPQTRPPGWPKPAPARPRPRLAGKAGPSERAGAPAAQPRTGKGLGRPAPKTVAEAPVMEGTADHPIHLAHETFGTAPSRRVGIAMEGRSAGETAAAAAMRRLLSSDRDSLRQAVILQEILGPPPGLSEE